MITLIKNSLANLKGHKLRLAIAFIWIIIGITSVVFVSSMGNAMSAVFKQSFKTIAPRAAIIYFEPSDDAFKTNQILFDPFSSSDVQILKTLDGVEKIETSDKYVSSTPTLGSSNDVYSDITYFDKIGSGAFVPSTDAKYKVTKGRSLTPADDGKRVIVLESNVVKDMFEDENPIGKGVTIKGLTYEVVGVLDSDTVYDPVEKGFKKRTPFDTSVPSSVVPEFSYNIISGKIANNSSINQVIVTVAEGFEISNVSDSIISELTSLHPNIMGEYKVQDRSSIQKSTEEMTKGIDKTVRLITIIAMVVGGVGIMNIMYVSVMERSKEIGIRRALGAKPRSILFQFLIESVFITTCGGVLGVIVGYAVTIYSKNFLPFKPIPSINTFLYSFIAIVLTGIIFGLVPALKASKVDPVKIIYK